MRGTVGLQVPDCVQSGISGGVRELGKQRSRNGPSPASCESAGQQPLPYGDDFDPLRRVGTAR